MPGKNNELYLHTDNPQFSRKDLNTIDKALWDSKIDEDERSILVNSLYASACKKAEKEGIIG